MFEASPLIRIVICLEISNIWHFNPLSYNQAVNIFCSKTPVLGTKSRQYENVYGDLKIQIIIYMKICI